MQRYSHACTERARDVFYEILSFFDSKYGCRMVECQKVDGCSQGADFLSFSESGILGMEAGSLLRAETP